jgi:hypothetical protein
VQSVERVLLCYGLKCAYYTIPGSLIWNDSFQTKTVGSEKDLSIVILFTKDLAWGYCGTEPEPLR